MTEAPSGTVRAVLASVGDDPTRAQRAYDAEIVRPFPRMTLLGALVRRGAEPANTERMLPE